MSKQRSQLSKATRGGNTSPNGQAADKTPKTMRVELYLRVENNSKFVQGKSKVRAEIEAEVLSNYQMEKAHENNWEYTLTIPYDTDQDLDKTIEDMLTEMHGIADMRYCFIEADFVALDGSERSYPFSWWK